VERSTADDVGVVVKDEGHDASLLAPMAIEPSRKPLGVPRGDSGIAPGHTRDSARVCNADGEPTR
jgi:hypothetical protein